MGFMSVGTVFRTTRYNGAWSYLTHCSLHALVSRDEALEWAPRPNKVFEEGVASLERDVSNPLERAVAFFLFGAFQRFFCNGNKGTSRCMMNGVLMSEGIDAISIPAVRAREFNARMVDFYTTRNATEMVVFMVECHPEIVEIRRLNPELPPVAGLPNIICHSANDSPRKGP